MELYFKGTTTEFNGLVYGDSREVDRIAEEDNPNIPIGDDDDEGETPSNDNDNVVGRFEVTITQKE